MIEEWKPVPNFEESYEVSNTGRVRSFDRVRPLLSRSGNMTEKKFRGRVLYQNKNNKGYVMVYLCLYAKRKSCTVHRLVAQAFIPNPDNLPEVNHKDGDKDNNSVENLEWSTVADNRRHAFTAGLQPSRKGKKYPRHKPEGNDTNAE